MSHKLLPLDVIKNHRFVIFCQDHYNPLTLIRSLGEEGIRPIVILVSLKPYLVNKSRYIGKLHIVSNIEDGYSTLTSCYGDPVTKDFLYTASDDIESYIDLHYDDLKEKFFIFNSGEQGKVTSLMNKEAINLLAAQVGFRIPKAVTVSHGVIPDDIPFPVMTKAIISTRNNWKNDVYICKNGYELQEAYKSIKSNPVLVEEYIVKKNELCIDGISINGGEQVFMPFKANYIRMSEKSYGNYMTISLFKDDVLKAKIQDLIKATGFSGIFSIEFLITPDDDLVFLEVNFRHSTWTSSSAYGGANLLALWALATITNKIPISDLQLKSEPFTAMAEVSDFYDSVRTGKISFWQWLHDFHKCEYTYLYSTKDLYPVFSLLKTMAQRFLSKLLRLR